MQSTHTSIARGQVVASSSNPNSKQQRTAKPNSGSLAFVCNRSSRNVNLGVRNPLCCVVGRACTAAVVVRVFALLLACTPAGRPMTLKLCHRHHPCCGAQAQATARAEALQDTTNANHSTPAPAAPAAPAISPEHAAMQDQYACQVADMEQILAERDACGVRGRGGLWWMFNTLALVQVGFIASLRNEHTHNVVAKALLGLSCMEHRGACSADDVSGDGSGVMTKIPWQLLAKQFPDLDQAHTGVGMMFLPNDDALVPVCKKVVEDAAAAEGLAIVGWRDVPVDQEVVGRMARATQPRIVQVIVRADGLQGDELERELFILRKGIERRRAAALGERAEELYVCTLSSRTIVYKGMLQSSALGRFYKDLTDPDYVTPFAIYHRRFSTNTTPKWPLAQPMRVLGHNGEINTLQVRGCGGTFFV